MQNTASIWQTQLVKLQQFFNPLHRLLKDRLQNLTPSVNDWTNKLLTVELTLW